MARSEDPLEKSQLFLSLAALIRWESKQKPASPAVLERFLREEEKTIDLDFNSKLGDRVRSFGSTGETEIIGCLVNTYLDAYDCEGIQLTEEGQKFETSSGADFDGYTGRIEF